MTKKRIKVIILANEIPDDHHGWESACRRFSDQMDYRVIDLTTSNWMEKIRETDSDILLAKPSGLISSYKQLYDERIYIIANELKREVFPSPLEIFIYENKRFFASWLRAHSLPHPKTHVFYQKAECLEFLKNTEYPLVAKVNIGASGSGVKILNQQEDAISYVNASFDGSGAPQRTGPNLEKGGLLQRAVRLLFNPAKLRKRLQIYRRRQVDLQKGFVIFQEFIPHEFEWRVVKIGDSFFAHKKLKVGEKASGSLLKNYDNPPLAIFDFVKELTDRFGFFSQAVDLFETSDGKYLINEMQCIFGQSDPYQMLVNGQPGRYRYLNSKWVFEEGDFAKNACYDLRVEYVINQLSNKKD